MEVEQQQQQRPPAITFDEASMERSKGFVTALHELKNLRPQLYSAAEYCEKSYLHSEQKQMVLDNLKDYVVRALVNAVDHLGTVAYKLTDLLDQQTSDVSTMELKISCLNQQILTCQTYTEKEGLRQQQLLAIIPRHHKHYILPNSVNKKVHFSPNIKTGARQSHIQAKPQIFPSGTPASKTLSWHLASETKSTVKGSPRAVTSVEDAKTSCKSSGKFQFSDTELVGPESSGGIQALAVSQRDSKTLTAFRSFDNPTLRDIVQVPVRSKSMLSNFFVKQKTTKLKTGAVS